MKKTSIKTNIRWLLVSFALILSCLFVLLILAYSWVVEDNIFNRMLHSEAQYIEHTYANYGTVPAPRFPFMRLHASWDSLPETLQLLQQQSPERVEFPVPGQGTIHIKTIQLGQSSKILAANVTEYEVSRDYLPKLLPWFLVSIIIVGAIAALLARYLSGSIVKPLRYLSGTVQRHQGDTPLRFEKRFPDNEIGYLANVIERDMNQLQQALQRETSFTRDVSHELRTPVSVIQMIVGQLNTHRPISAQSLSQLQSYSQQLEQTIDILLALARAESVTKQSFCLTEVIEDSIINHPVLAHAAETICEIDVDAGYQITANKNLFRLLLNNVLDNVAHHASEIKLSIWLFEDQLCIANPSTEASSEDLLQPGVKGGSSTGIGQGLHLIQRICEQSGWRISVDTSRASFAITIVFNTRPK